MCRGARLPAKACVDVEEGGGPKVDDGYAWADDDGEKEKTTARAHSHDVTSAIFSLEAGGERPCGDS